MPKLKTHRAAAKRYKVTGTGKITRRHAGIGHLLQHKSESRKRKIFGDVVISETHENWFQKSYLTRSMLDRSVEQWELNVEMYVVIDTKKY